MINLNLLPPVKKQEFHLTQIYISIKNLIILVLFFTAIIAIILLLTKLILQNHFNEVVDQTTLTTKYSVIFNRDIKEFNQHLSAVEEIQKNYFTWSELLITFIQLVPNDISIYNLNILQEDKVGTKIFLNGQAKSRTNLLEFKNNLQNSNLFSDVVIPLENLLQKENINFDIKADINLPKSEEQEDDLTN